MNREPLGVLTTNRGSRTGSVMPETSHPQEPSLLELMERVLDGGVRLVPATWVDGQACRVAGRTLRWDQNPMEPDRVGRERTGRERR
jgi:hypothetical protein